MKKVDPRVVAALGIMVLTPSGLRCKRSASAVRRRIKCIRRALEHLLLLQKFNTNRRILQNCRPPPGEANKIMAVSVPHFSKTACSIFFGFGLCIASLAASGYRGVIDDPDCFVNLRADEQPDAAIIAKVKQASAFPLNAKKVTSGAISHWLPENPGGFHRIESGSTSPQKICRAKAASLTSSTTMLLGALPVAIKKRSGSSLAPTKSWTEPPRNRPMTFRKSHSHHG